MALAEQANSLEQKLTRLTAQLSARDPAGLLAGWCSLALEESGAGGVGILLKDAGGVRAVAACGKDIPEEGGIPHLPPSWLLALASACGKTLAQSVTRVSLGSPGEGLLLPLSRTGGGELVLGACFAPGTAPAPGATNRLLVLRALLLLCETSMQQAHLIDTLQGGKARTDDPQHARGAAGGNGREAAGSDGTASSEQRWLSAILQILGDVQGTSRFFEACVRFCAATAASFHLFRVCLGTVRLHDVRLTAVDQMANFSRGTRSVRLVEEAMQECLQQDRIVLYSRPAGETRAETREDGQEEHRDDAPEAAEERLASLEQDGVICAAAAAVARNMSCSCVFAIPLKVDGQTRFVALFLCDRVPDEQEVNALRLAGSLCAPRLQDMCEAERFFLVRAWRHLLLRTGDLFGPSRTALKLAGAVLLLVLVVSFTVQGRLTVTAPLVVEGMHTYTHTSPVDSFLVEVHARPGDEIRAGDLLGRLDSTDILLEISALTAQKRIHESQSFQLSQEGREAEASLAMLEAEKDTANLEWARSRLGMTELRAGFDGFLVSEDMFPRIGQPVARGQALFEVADIRSLRIVLRVNEEDIADVRAAVQAAAASNTKAGGEFTLTAYPSEPIAFQVERVHPFAEVVDEQNSFEVHGTVASLPEGIMLRPGMEGLARLDAGSASWFTLWTRRLAHRLSLLWWKWF